MTLTKEARLVTMWLARTHPIPEQAHAEWVRHGVALLPLGRRFDAIRVPAARIHAAVSSSEAETVAAALAAWLDGPVFRDTRYSGGPYYVLVPAGAPWDGKEEHLGAGTYLGVPRIGDLAMLAVWVVQPKFAGDVVHPAHLAALLAAADPLEAIES